MTDEAEKSVGKYRLISILGEGQFAVVYKAKDPNDKLVAVKKVKVGDRYETANGINQTALREMKFLPELNHKNVIMLLDVFGLSGAVSKNICLVFEYMEADLEQIIQDRSLTLSTTHVKSYMVMMLEGLIYLHDNWIVHRDLKPNNLLINDEGVLKIGDFGLAKFFGSPDREMTYQVVTRWYRAPELLFGARYYGSNIDMWAVGCIFAELLLRVPFLAGDTDINQLQKIFEVFGTPTNANWPLATRLPDYIEFKPMEPVLLSTVFRASSADELDLLTGIMTLDPMRRFSAVKSLESQYFARPPGPFPPKRLPETGNKHKINATSTISSHPERTAASTKEF